MKHVDTTEYQKAHGRKPRGLGRWIFRNPRTGEQVAGTGLYSDIASTLAGNGWVLCS